MAAEVNPQDGVAWRGAEGALEPIAASERITSIDVLRGVALLGILPMNMPFFADTAFAFFNPPLSGGFEGVNRLLWVFGHVAFELKMMALFSMLFGAGLIVIADRAERTGRSPAGRYYKRIFWLLVIGLVHAYGFWYGDILVVYALNGFWIYLFRKAPAKVLIPLGLAMTLVAVVIQSGVGHFFEYARDQASAAEVAIAAGLQPDETQLAMKDAWQEMSADFVATRDSLLAERRDYLEGGWGLFVRRAEENLFFQTFGMLLFGLWRPGGLMLVGMGLMKLGVFSAGLRRSSYLAMALIGVSVGWIVSYYGTRVNIEHEFDFVHGFQSGLHYNYVGSLFTAFGYIGVVMLFFQAAGGGWLATRLASVGRMALTNYLMHTLICTTLFYGYGLGMWGRLDRFSWWYLTLVIWSFQLVMSHVWLSSFRFGPAEWLWRSLSYGRLQEFRRAG